MNSDDLRLAPAGASDAACAVCLRMTFNRFVEGDGHVPICSACCLQAWPRVRDLLADRDEWRRPHENAMADKRALLRVSRAAKAFRDWDAIGALLSGDEPHAEDAQNDLRELDGANVRALLAELPSPAERKLLRSVREARRSKLAEAIATDLENCALDTPCANGCQYGIDQDTPHAEDCPQEVTVGVLLAIAALLAPDVEVIRDR